MLRSETVYFRSCDYPGCTVEDQVPSSGKPDGWAAAEWVDGCPAHREFIEAHRLRIVDRVSGRGARRRTIFSGYCGCDQSLSWDDQRDLIRKNFWLPHVAGLVREVA